MFLWVLYSEAGYLFMWVSFTSLLVTAISQQVCQLLVAEWFTFEFFSCSQMISIRTQKLWRKNYENEEYVLNTLNSNKPILLLLVLICGFLPSVKFLHSKFVFWPKIVARSVRMGLNKRDIDDLWWMRFVTFFTEVSIIEKNPLFPCLLLCRTSLKSLSSYFIL